MRRISGTSQNTPEAVRLLDLYLLGALLVLGMLYLWNISVVGKNTVEPAALSDSTAFVQDLPLQSPAVLPPVDVTRAG